MALSPFERNNYFYGKLLDVPALRKEQAYFNNKRWLLNRLVTGSGIVCGLDVVPGPNNGVTIQPGVAIDSLGREIVVTEAYPIDDPGRLTDEHGDLTDARIEEGDTVEICLAYRVTLTEPVPAFVPECDTPADGCVHSTIRENFCVLVREVEESLTAVSTCHLDDFQLPVEGDSALNEAINQRIRQVCTDTPEVSETDCAWLACVPIARLTLSSSNAYEINTYDGVGLVYNNAILYELLLCLAEQVADLAQAPILRYVSGDGQTAPPGVRLDNELVVEVVNSGGARLPGITVNFETVTETGVSPETTFSPTDTIRADSIGKLKPPAKETDDYGRASTVWTLGNSPGVQQVIARVVGSVFTVTFTANATDR